MSPYHSDSSPSPRTSCHRAAQSRRAANLGVLQRPGSGVRTQRPDPSANIWSRWIDVGVKLDHVRASAARQSMLLPSRLERPVRAVRRTDTCYLPSSIAVSADDTVVWENEDNAAHTVTYGDPQTFPTPIFDSGLLPPGAAVRSCVCRRWGVRLLGPLPSPPLDGRTGYRRVAGL